MEHSTLTLDISSDEEGSKQVSEDRGKENMPPPGYEAPAARGSASPVDPADVVLSTAKGKQRKTQNIPRKVLKPDEMDDGQRSPLSDLETEDFYAAGLSKDSVITITPVAEEASDAVPSTAELGKEVEASLYAAPVAKTTSKDDEPTKDKVVDIPVVTSEGDLAGDIVIWEDDSNGQSSPLADGRL